MFTQVRELQGGGKRSKVVSRHNGWTVLPKNWRQSKNKDFDMAECGECLEWYYGICEKIDDNVYTGYFKDDYVCKNCKKS